MKRITLFVLLSITFNIFSQTVYQFDVIAYTSYQAKGLKKFNDVIPNSINTVQKEYKQTVVVNYDPENEYLGYLITYDENDFFGSQKNMLNRKIVSNSMTFDFNHYEWTNDGYLPTIKKTFKFSLNNAHQPMIYFYNPTEDMSYLIKYEISNFLNKN